MCAMAVPAELATTSAWSQQHFTPAGPPPLSLKIDGEPANFADWSCEQADGVFTWIHSSGLVLTVETRLFESFAAVEWLVHIENRSSAPSPLLSDLLPLDCEFTGVTGHTVLHWAKGSDCQIDDFAPCQAAFYNHPTLTLQSTGGRSSQEALPFFNLQWGDQGLIGAVGWTGSWKLDFLRGKDSVRIRGGMPRTNLRLNPGERIRLPRMLLLFWQGERLHGHNLLRQLILQHYTPRPGGQLLQAPVCNAVWGENTEHQQIAKARWWVDRDLPLEYFWIDAGWYGDGRFNEASTVFNSEWGLHVGNWWPNKGPYPKGLKPVGEALREMGLGFVLWFEPERVRKDTYFTREHPEWLLGPQGNNYLFNLGLPEARQAMTDLLSGIITEAGVTCYRQDFNMAATPFWEAADAPDRVGMSEIRHIEGLYQMWDDLLARHEGLIIDNCSSGGRRIDLETISRSIPLWRSDYQCFPGFDPVGMQGQTHGLSLWVPLSAGCCERSDDYGFTSALSPGMVLSTNLFERDPVDFAPPEWLREMMNRHRLIRPYFYGDYYPLLGYSLDNEDWAAWQFDRPDLGEGAVIALRRPQSALAAVTVQLHGLEPQARYELQELGDGGGVVQVSGADLAGGLNIEISERPGQTVITYRRL